MGASFFLRSDGGDVQKAVARVVNWVHTHPLYEEAAKQEFFSSRGDLLLVSYALAHGCTVVTFERDRPQAKGRVMIPSVCAALDVECIDLFRFLKAYPMRLVLQENPN